MLRAGIDIGTNTILLLIAEVAEGKVTHVLEDHVRVVRLGQGVDKNRLFAPEAMDRARACFRDYSEVLARYPGIEIRAFATSGSRDARNSSEFFHEIEREYAIPVRVISGEEEARVSFLGALPENASAPEQLAVIDIGGGSTEIVGLESRDSDHLFRFSFDMGCVRLTERFLPSDPPLPAEVDALRAFVREELRQQSSIVEGLRGRKLIGVAGTATYLAAAALGLTRFEPDRVHGARLRLHDVRELAERFAKIKAEARLGVGGMDKGRADVIVGGAVILEETMRAAGISELTASVRGLRYGAVLI